MLVLPATACPSVAIHFEVASDGCVLREEVLSRYWDFSAQHVAEGGSMSWDCERTESEDSICAKIRFRLSCEADVCDDAAILQSVVEDSRSGWEVLVSM